MLVNKKYLAVEVTEPIKAVNKSQFMQFASSLWDKIEDKSVAILEGHFEPDINSITIKFVEESPWWVKYKNGRKNSEITKLEERGGIK